MDDRQQRVFRYLEGRSSKLSATYEFALALLSEPPKPGAAIARLSLICHCLRELVNGLPEATAENVPRRPDPSSGQMVSELAKLVAVANIDLSGETVPISRPVAETLLRLYQARVAEDGLNRQLARVLIPSDTRAEDPAARQWREAAKFFEKWHHMDRTPDGERNLPSDENIALHIRVVEDVVETKEALFFDSLRSVRDILESANRRGSAE